MNRTEFDDIYEVILYAQEGVPKEPEQIKKNTARKNLLWNDLKGMDVTVFKDAISKACRDTDFMPKLSAIRKCADEIMNSKPISNGGSKLYQTELEWIMSIPVESAKYYEHKLKNDYERNTVLKKLRAAGIQDFEPLDNCPGYRKFKEFLESDEWKNSSIQSLQHIERSEYDDSGPIDPLAQVLINTVS